MGTHISHITNYMSGVLRRGVNPIEDFACITVYEYAHQGREVLHIFGSDGQLLGDEVMDQVVITVRRRTDKGTALTRVSSLSETQ